MAPSCSRFVLPVAAAGALLVAPAAAAQVPPAGVPVTGPPPGFGGTLVQDPAFAGGGGPGGGGQGEGGGDGTTEPQPTNKLSATRARLSGRVVKVDVVCQVAGKLTLRAWPSRTRLAAKRFGCDDGSVLVRLTLSHRDMRKLRRSGWHAKLILTGGGERHRYTVTFPSGRSARAAAYLYWQGAEAYCGILTPTGFKYRLSAPPIAASIPGGGPDVGWVRYYWYRFGVGWVGDSGWGEPFDIPDEPTGAVFLGAGWEYLLKVDSHAWYAGAIAIWWRNAGVGDWNWVSTFPQNAFNPVAHNTWCATDP